jgi:hypothetical protein
MDDKKAAAEILCRCGHPIGQHEILVNPKSRARRRVRCGVLVKGKRCQKCRP